MREPFSAPAADTNRPAVERIARELLDDALRAGSVEVVRSFALPLQSRALAVMLGRPQTDADEWISWGTHVFRDAEGHASELDDYLGRTIDEAIAQPGEDFFGLLATATFRGRPLQREEMLGFANLTFAGGRDTVINAIATALHHLATHPDDAALLRERPELIPAAIEEFLRYFSPLTHIGRIDRASDEVVSLGFASANRDAAVFERAGECVLDRSPNRHVAFGFGPHTCLGAPHARVVLAVVLELFTTHVREMSVVSAEPIVEDLGGLRRQVGFDPLVLSLD